AKESIERADARLILAVADERAVAAEDVRLRHREQRAGLAGISQNEFASLDRVSLAREWLDAAALDRRLVDAILVAQRIEIPGLRAEVLQGQDRDPREALVLFPGDGEGTAPLFLRIADGLHCDMDLAGTVRLFPVRRIVDADIAKLLGARGHPHAERLGETLQRLPGEPERF